MLVIEEVEHEPRIVQIAAVGEQMYALDIEGGLWRYDVGRHIHETTGESVGHRNVLMRVDLVRAVEREVA